MSDTVISPRHGMLVLHAGRVLLASLFILGGLNKILNFSATQVQMMDMGFPFVHLVLPATILFELGGGMIVAIGRFGAAPAAMLLVIHTIAINIIFHDFWTMSGQEAQTELSLFFKNVSVIGGLLFFWASPFPTGARKPRSK